MKIISLGAGVQSTTLALMAKHGDIEMPDCAIFADTGWEPQAVYDHLAWLTSVLPFPVHVVSAGNIRDNAIDGESSRTGNFAAIPWFTINSDGSTGMGARRCTSHYKIEPIQRHIRSMLGVAKGRRVPKGTRVEMWVGISRDEMMRMKDSALPWIDNRWPLIEAGMTRQACLRWLEQRQYSAPKSACLGCPFHSDAMWRDLRDNDPTGWADALAVDVAIRDQKPDKGRQFMHAQRVPLDQVDLSTAADRGQIEFGFLQECEGMCGV